MYWIGIDSIISQDVIGHVLIVVVYMLIKESVFLCWDVLKHYKWFFTFSVYLTSRESLSPLKKKL